MRRKKRRIVAVVVTIVLVVFFCIATFLYYQGIRSGRIIANHPSEKRYPVRGVDVSAYQGNIDWEILANQGIHFAFIKATEGSGFVDSCFQKNFENAGKTELRIGAYHFFSYDSSGKTQAENFIKTVPKKEGMLPPVVDIEFYGDKSKNLPDKAKTQQQLTVLFQKLEDYYGMKPILYVTHQSYRLYIADAYEGYPIWIRNVYTAPGLFLDRDWTFWQYSDHMKLEGYSGEEECIDMNVFYGSLEEFYRFPDDSTN